jgi:hypothetical protein
VENGIYARYHQKERFLVFIQRSQAGQARIRPRPISRKSDLLEELETKLRAKITPEELPRAPAPMKLKLWKNLSADRKAL